MPAVVGDIVNAVINLLSQVPGFVTQTYAAGRIQQHVQDALLLELEEMWWPDYMAHIGPIGVDPVTGLLTQDLVGPLATITEYRDIAAVFPADSNQKLAELPQSMNPLLLTSGRMRFIGPDYTVSARPFRVYPANGDVGVSVWARQRPNAPLKLTDRVYIDATLIQYDACWMYAVDDGTIPAQVNKFQVLASNRRRMVKAGYGQHPILLDPRIPADGTLDSMGDGGFFILDEDPLA
jgi:hypothetical protein